MFVNQGVNVLTEIEPKSPTFEIFFLLAFGYYKLKNFSLSFKFLTKCFQLEPENEQARILLAKYYKKRGELNKSLNILLKTSELIQTNPEVNYLIAEIYRLKKFTNNAVEYYDRVQSMIPENCYLSQVVDTLKESII